MRIALMLVAAIAVGLPSLANAHGGGCRKSPPPATAATWVIGLVAGIGCEGMGDAAIS